MKKTILILLGILISSKSAYATLIKNISINEINHEISFPLYDQKVFDIDEQLYLLIKNKEIKEEKVIKLLSDKISLYSKQRSKLYFLSWQNSDKHQIFTVFHSSPNCDQIWYFVYDNKGQFIDNAMLAYECFSDAAPKGKGEFIVPSLYLMVSKGYNEYWSERDLPEWGVDIVEYQINLDTGEINELILRKRASSNEEL